MVKFIDHFSTKNPFIKDEIIFNILAKKHFYMKK